MKQKIILDTDIGDDVDDSLALLLLLKSQEVEVIGVTTVYANTPLRSRLVKKILSMAGFNHIPVYSGKRNPLVGNTDIHRSFVQFTEDLLDEKFMPNNTIETTEGEEAIDFILDSARKFKDNLTILAIGPFTNIACAIQKDKLAMSYIHQIVLMGGCFYEQFIEYNVFCDPEAAQIVYQSGLPTINIGADVTWQVQLNDQQTKQILDYHDSGLKGYAAELVRLWKENCWFNPVLHDPLAAYYLVDNSICSFEEVWVEVETSFGVCRGLTLNRDHCLKYLEHKVDANRICCAQTVNKEKFIQEFLKRTFDF